MGRITGLTAAALLIGITAAHASTVSVTDVSHPRPGTLRITVGYESGGTPRFRLAPRCAAPSTAEWVFGASVKVDPGRHSASLELGDDLAWVAAQPGCEVTGIAVEMLEQRAVVARADVPVTIPAPRVAAAVPPPPATTPARFGISGKKYLAPQTRMTEARVMWLLSDRVTPYLAYERTGYAPMMPRDHDDGIMT